MYILQLENVSNFADLFRKHVHSLIATNCGLHSDEEPYVSIMAWQEAPRKYATPQYYVSTKYVKYTLNGLDFNEGMFIGALADECDVLGLVEIGSADGWEIAKNVVRDLELVLDQEKPHVLDFQTFEKARTGSNLTAMPPQAHSGFAPSTHAIMGVASPAPFTSPSNPSANSMAISTPWGGKGILVK